MGKSLQELIVEAIEEARILECARETYDTNNVILTAQRLSGASFSFTNEIYKKMFSGGVDITL
jgi:hypothetical protein